MDVIARLRGQFTLGWSHYIALLSVTNPDARRFYEIEAADNGWSVRELMRQLDSSLYERLALSRDKHEVRRLAREGQVVEKASDLIKDPVVLEFLGLEERPAYSESDLETAIIDRLQQFLLELGKGSGSRPDADVCEDANIYASKYQLYLPSKQELAEQLAIVRREVGGRERKG